MAGGLLCVIASRQPADASEPPRITTLTQTPQQLEPGGVSRLGIQAEDPQGGPLTFSWSATTGSLGRPLGNASTSRVSWTAPLCLASGSTPSVQATVTNGLGLSSTAALDFSIPQDLGKNRQPAFSAAGFEQFENVTLVDGRISVPEPARPSSDFIVFPEDQQLSVMFVNKESLASHSVGYLYVDDLRQRGYVDAVGELTDFNQNGIADLHEDLYNLAPPSGAQARPYIGRSRRCSRAFASQGMLFTQPELALDANCADTFSPGVFLPDARPGPHLSQSTDIIGRDAPASVSPSNTGFSDGGLFARIPNLLEPATPENDDKGLGHLVFLLTDDDWNRTTYRGLGTVPDAEDVWDGIPDYDVSAYDARGVRRSTNPDPGITPADRRVDLGHIQGGREVVFFLVVNMEAVHDPDNSVVYPCLRKQGYRCVLHLKSPLSVFFSKTRWNLDQDSQGERQATVRATGCAYDEACYPLTGQPRGCFLPSQGRRLCGWLPEDALERLQEADYGNTHFPLGQVDVIAEPAGPMPHVLSHPSLVTPGRWILGFEDLNGGGDRDYNDVVLQLVSPVPTGVVRSPSLVSQPSSPEETGCTVSRIRLRKSDGGAVCDAAPIQYAVATDCRVCWGGVCMPNPTPTWHPLTLRAGDAEAVIDVSGTPGTQPCWKAVLAPANGRCLNNILSVDVGYEYAPLNP
ncbi:DUF4114 domain-containing protein [Corallococcus aberystwythensis]|uniref:DUF4114 domain-containing protein n=1 Tax=Corallococcus aberystwythensis TaxID=2316722 RepID=A0A3A8PK48_9BACT|nr:DUF4114 domain-containing protein [Corallococcus aberystwythensis]RKH56757.1 DUF4114 domain-containing protein [Corallococcus aberystwythensis]